MRKDLREVFSNDLKVVKQIKGKLAREKAMEKLLERSEMYEIAKDFCYPQDVLDGIVAARTPLQAQNVLISARRKYL